MLINLLSPRSLKMWCVESGALFSRLTLFGSVVLEANSSPKRVICTTALTMVASSRECNLGHWDCLLNSKHSNNSRNTVYTALLFFKGQTPLLRLFRKLQPTHRKHCLPPTHIHTHTVLFPSLYTIGNQALKTYSWQEEELTWTSMFKLCIQSAQFIRTSSAC